MALGRDGAEEGIWLRADEQVNGRGRDGRIWVSPPGNLYASTLVRLRAADPFAPGLALIAGISLQEVAAAYAPAQTPMLKWPNDLMVDGAKLAGILLERERELVVAGFGVNLAHHPDGLERAVTSLSVLNGSAPSPADFLVSLADSFARWLGSWRTKGFAAVRTRWLERAHPAGTPLSVNMMDGKRMEGLFDGLDEAGALRLRLADGTLHIVQAGDVFLI
jgi:BirA family biotin operon repressor/biotin-[acetyl-CoA-carboxylase] ligase